MYVDDKICFECGSDYMIEKHHIIPKSLGGKKTIPLCVKCHELVHGKDFVKYRTLVNEGRKRAIERGVKFGRKHGSFELSETFLDKPKNKEIIKFLKMGKSQRYIISKLRCSPKTITKCRNLIKENIETINHDFWID